MNNKLKSIWAGFVISVTNLLSSRVLEAHLKEAPDDEPGHERHVESTFLDWLRGMREVFRQTNRRHIEGKAHILAKPTTKTIGGRAKIIAAPTSSKPETPEEKLYRERMESILDSLREDKL